MSLRSKYPKHLSFQVNTQWNGRSGGISETDHGYNVEFAIPESFGGHGGALCPDELFLASIAGCLMNTFLHTRDRLELEMEAFNLKTKAEVEFKNGRYQITNVLVYGKLIVKEGEEELGEECVYFAKKYCHIAQSLLDCISIEYQISIESSNE